MSDGEGACEANREEFVEKKKRVRAEWCHIMARRSSGLRSRNSIRDLWQKLDGDSKGPASSKAFPLHWIFLNEFSSLQQTAETKKSSGYPVTALLCNA